MKRRIPMDQDFMDFGIDDLIYGFLSYHATYNPNTEELYLTRKKFLEVKKQYEAFIKVLTRKTLTRHINKLIEKNYILMKPAEDGEIIYVFTEDSEEWELIDREMLMYLIRTRNFNCIKVYCYLLKKYKWKRQTKEYYSFTIGEIITALGYSENCVDTQSVVLGIKIILESLTREGYLKIEDYFDGKAPRKRLLFVAKKVDELRKLD